jgi:hypothetical protein
MIGYDLKAGKITINGPGTEPISTTSIADVARFVVHVLVRLPRSQLENAKFQFEGDRFVSCAHGRIPPVVTRFAADPERPRRRAPEGVEQAARDRSRPAHRASEESRRERVRLVRGRGAWMGRRKGRTAGAAFKRPLARVEAEEGDGDPDSAGSSLNSTYDVSCAMKNALT